MRIPVALAGVIVTVLVQLGAGIWFASFYVAQQAHMGRALEKIDAKVDGLFNERITTRDLEPMRLMLTDHETRLRAVERRP